MANHGGHKHTPRVIGPGRIALRSLSAAVVVGFSVFAFGFQGPAPSIQQPVGAAVPIDPPSGVVGPELLDPDTTAPAYPISGSSIAAPAKAPTGRTVSSSTVKATKTSVPKSPGVASSALKRPAPGFLMAPLEVLTPSSPFGSRRNPLTGEMGEFHWGQDFAAACGTRVYAADSGVVRAAGWHPWGGGNRVEIDHGNGIITTYNHLQGIAVQKGDHVRVGEIIAEVGTTGSSTGCHLHFEVIKDGQHEDPMKWTLLPIRQTDQLTPAVFTSFEGGAATTYGWAIPNIPGNSGPGNTDDGLTPATAAAVANPNRGQSDAVRAALVPSSSGSRSSSSGSQASRPAATPTGTATPKPKAPKATVTTKPKPAPKPTPTPTATPTPPPAPPATPTPTPTTPAPTTPPPADPAPVSPPPTDPAVPAPTDVPPADPTPTDPAVPSVPITNSEPAPTETTPAETVPVPDPVPTPSSAEVPPPAEPAPVPTSEPTTAATPTAAPASGAAAPTEGAAAAETVPTTAPTTAP